MSQKHFISMVIKVPPALKKKSREGPGPPPPSPSAACVRRRAPLFEFVHARCAKWIPLEV